MRKDISCGSLIILQVGSKDWTIIMERKKKKLGVSLQLRNLKWFNFQASKSTVIWPLLKGRSWSQLVLDSCLLLELCQQACGVLKTFPNQQMFEMYLFCQNVNMCYFSSCPAVYPSSGEEGTALAQSCLTAAIYQQVAENTVGEGRLV